ncbi:MAG TPA: RsiV family protein, partial [Anaerolineales bacterium]|nr:RsiV family protein [Anaerolineales bacterium]
TAIPTNTSIPLSGQVTLVSQPYTESNQDPAFTITAQTPQLSGSDDPRVQAFNQKLDEMVQKEVVVFRQEFTNAPAIEVTTNSFLEVTYTVFPQYDDIWSFKFLFNFYNNGAAHPGEFSHTINYDLNSGRELALGDLFLAGSNYLEVISSYCITELNKQPFFDGPFTNGADPTLENYRNWNITPEGLMFTFDTYQVAPGAAGPQIVRMPYGELGGLINPDGPLGKFNQ